MSWSRSDLKFSELHHLLVGKEPTPPNQCSIVGTMVTAVSHGCSMELRLHICGDFRFSWANSADCIHYVLIRKWYTPLECGFLRRV